jgi:hypothetical protein
MYYRTVDVATLTSDKWQTTHNYFLTIGKIRTEFATFKSAVNLALRGVEFCHVGIDWAYVYRKGDTHALGKIGFGDMLKNARGDNQYGVSSRRIENKKYRDDSEHYYIAASKTLKVAVTTACTNLVPFSVQEAMYASRTQFQNKSGEELQRVSKVVDESYEKAVRDNSFGVREALNSRLMKELRVLVESEYNFTDPSLAGELKDMFAAQAAYNELSTIQKKPLYFVKITESFGQTVGQVALVDWSKYRYSREFDAGGTLMHAPVEHLPQFILGGVAVLSMVEPNQYVAGVGMRVDDRQFFIAEQEEN